jgi:NitT/TauT family transport system ATP-binding protein
MPSSLPNNTASTGALRNGAALLSVQRVSVIFPGEGAGLHAIDDVSFDVPERQFVCILGPSGTGKSTLLRVLAGLLKATHGEVRLAGEPLDRPRREVGFVFQKANLMPWRTALENITLPLELEGLDPGSARQKALEMVELVGLSGSEDVLPRDLSGGMAQRVAIARALVHDPDILLLDEPFGSLDALTRERMGAELLRIWQKHQKTVIMVTHSISEALFLADRVLVLSGRPGRLVLDLPVGLSRPRLEEMRYSAEFGDLAARVRSGLE